MKLRILAQAALFVVLSAGAALAGNQQLTCDSCSDECLESPYSKGCPDICRDPQCQASCADCSDECKVNPYAQGCPDICKEIACQSCDDCSDECKTNPYAQGCPDICRDIKCYSCDDCSAECIENPEGEDCPPVCDELGCNICDKFPRNCPASCKENPDGKDCPALCEGIPEDCLMEEAITEEEIEEPSAVTCDDCPQECEDNPKGCPAECQELDCYTTAPSLLPWSLRFIGDVGYLRLSDPADYAFGRVGVEYRPYVDMDNAFKDISFLLMVGAAPKVEGSDGDDALLIDAFAQYNWSTSFDGFIGLGLGGWISAGDNDIDSEDTDLDILANIGARVYGDPDYFNISLFLEARNAVDELDSMSQYGRFGIGLRFQM